MIIFAISPCFRCFSPVDDAATMSRFDISYFPRHLPALHLLFLFAPFSIIYLTMLDAFAHSPPSSYADTPAPA